MKKVIILLLCMLIMLPSLLYAGVNVSVSKVLADASFIKGIVIEDTTGNIGNGYVLSYNSSTTQWEFGVQTSSLDTAQIMDIVQDSISGDITLNSSSVAAIGTSVVDSNMFNSTEIDEYIADKVGVMTTGNTETGITVTYQDADNTIDYEVNVTVSDSISASDLNTDVAADSSSWNATADALGTTIDSTKVIASSLAESNLSIDGGPTDEYCLTWEASSGTGGQMKWEVQAGTGYWELNGPDSLMYIHSDDGDTLLFSKSAGVWSFYMGADGVLQTDSAYFVNYARGDSLVFNIATIIDTLNIPNSANPTTDAEGHIAWDTDDDAIEVYDGTRSVLIPSKEVKEALFWFPDGITDTVPVFEIDSAIAQNGIVIENLSVLTSEDGTYQLEFFSYTSADPPTLHDYVDTLDVGASDQFVSSNTFEDVDAQTLDVGQRLYMLTPSTDIDWIKIKIRYYIKDNN